MFRTRWSAVLAGTVAFAAWLSPPAYAQSRVFEHLSIGNVNGNSSLDASFSGASPDALRVVFRSPEELVQGDADQSVDLYERGPSGLALLTGGSEQIDVAFRGISVDGSRVFFSTDESLAGGDAGQREDVYEASGGGLTLLSPGSPNYDWTINGNTPDGSRVFLWSDHPYNGLDTGGFDVFRRNPNGTIDYVSVYDDAAENPFFEGSADDGSRVFFKVSSTTKHAIRVRTATGVEEVSGDILTGLSLAWNGNSADGSRAFFTSEENLMPGQLGGSPDIYERQSDGDLRLISGGDFNPATFGATSTDGDRVFFTTPAQLTVEDTDPNPPLGIPYDSYDDVYERRGDDTLRLISGGEGPYHAAFRGSTPDGTHAFFKTAEPLLPGSDLDTADDVYERTAGGGLRLISGGIGNVEAFYAGVSGDGSHVFFYTTEKLLQEDVDSAPDVYSRKADGSLSLISSGTDAELVGFQASSPDGDRVILTTRGRLAPTDMDSAQDVYASRPADPVPPGGGGPEGGGGPPPPDGTDSSAPFLSSLLMPASVRPRLTGGSVAQRRRRGGTVRYVISEAATTRFTIQRAAPGRRVGRRCRRPSRRNSTRRRCTRWVVKGSFTHQSAAGPNSFVFTGRARGKRLRPGRHRLVARATDAAGNRGPAKTRRFRVIR